MGGPDMRRVAILAIVIVLAGVAGLIYLIVGPGHHQRGTAICITVGGRQRVPGPKCSDQPRSATPAYVTWYVWGPTPPIGAQVTGGAPTPTTQPSRVGPIGAVP